MVGGRPDTAQLARSEGGLQDVRCVERSAAGRSGAHDRVDLVDEEDGAGLLLERAEHVLQPLLEVAAEAGSRQQRAHVERVDVEPLQLVGYLAVVNLQCEAFGKRSLSHACIADEDRVVLATAAQYADRALDFLVAPDQRVDLPLRGELHEVDGESLKRLSRRPHRACFIGLALLGFACALARIARLTGLGDPVGEKAHHVETCDALLGKQEGRVRLGLAKERDEDVLDVDLLLARGLDVRGGSLHDPLEAQRLLQRLVHAFRETFDLVVEIALHLALQRRDVAPAVLEDVDDLNVMEKRVEDVLDRQELVTPPPRLVDGEGERLLEGSTDSHVRFTLRPYCSVAEIRVRARARGLDRSWSPRPRACRHRQRRSPCGERAA